MTSARPSAAMRSAFMRTTPWVEWLTCTVF